MAAPIPSHVAASALAILVSGCGNSQSPAPLATGKTQAANAGSPDATDTVAATCLAGGVPRVVATNGSTRICTADDQPCLAIDLRTGAAASAPYVEAEQETMMLSGTIDVNARKPTACFQGTCRPLKKRLRTAIRKAAELHEAHHDDGDDETWRAPTATTDLAAVAFSTADGEVQIWNLARDRPLVLKGDEGDYSMVTATPVGTEIFTEGLPPIARVFTSAGKLVELVGTARTQIRMLDGARWLALSLHHALYIFDGGSTHAVHAVDLAPKAVPSDTMDAGFTVLADRTVVVAIQRPDHPSVFVIDPQRAAIMREWPLTACSDR